MCGIRTLHCLQTHLSFSPEYERAVEAKQVAQQQAERGKYVVLKALEEKKSTIIRAQGEAEAAKLVSSRWGLFLPLLPLLLLLEVTGLFC